jgi:co-chaperonin GroES (HSP10)
MKLKAVGDKIHVERDPAEVCMEKGIIIPVRSQKTPEHNRMTYGTVLAVGAQVKNWKPGERIALREGWGDDYFYDNRTVTILSEREHRDCCRVLA